MIIAIDGPSGTGKSTVAQGVAAKLGILFFDTGAMYRSVAWLVLQKKIPHDDETHLQQLLETFSFSIQFDRKKGRRYFVGTEDVTEVIRTREIASLSSQISVYPSVRSKLVQIQREFARHSSAVFEGRDMGTVVFPGADVKIFLNAKAEVRAERRYRELLEKFPDLQGSFTFQEILKEIEERDFADAHREISPLKKAEDAIEIDTSELKIEEVIDRIVNFSKRSKQRFTKMKWSYWIVYWMARGFFRLFFRLKIDGIEHMRGGKGIIAANHVSFYDPEVLSVSCPEEVHFLAKESLFRIPVLGRLIRVLNTHPVAHDASDIQTLKQMVGLLKEGKKIIVFPEGKRSFDGKLQPLERGVAFLAQRSEATIFPAYLAGTFAAWPRGQKFPRLFGKMRCVFGSPIEWGDFAHLPKREAEAAVTEKCFEMILKLEKWLEEGAKGSPP